MPSVNAAEKYKVSAHNAALYKALADPLRGRILVILTERHATAKELSEMLGETLGNTSYHVRELRDVGLIEEVGETSRRGRFYKATARPIIDLESWEKLPRIFRELESVWVAQLFIGDLIESIHGRVFDKRAERTMLRSQLVVDEEGFDELEEIGARYLQEVMDVQARSAERISRDEEAQGFHVAAAAFAFELPGEQKTRAR